MLSPALVLPSLALALLLGPPVESPAVSPTQPAPGEAAIAPAHVEGDRAVTELAVTEPAPVDPEPIADPPPTTEPELPSWDTEPVEPVEPVDLPTDMGETEYGVDEWGTPLPPPPEKPKPPKGVALYASASGLFGAMVVKQLVMGLTCQDVYCGYRGLSDHGLGLGVMALAAGGGWMHGRHLAFMAHDAGKPAKPLTARRAAGWTTAV